MISYQLILSEFYQTKQWACDGDSYDGIQWFDSSAKPTQEEMDALWVPAQDNMAKQSCKLQASKLLYETDWTTIPDVADPSNTPYLTNQAEFIAWRNQVRALAVNPVVDPVFPPKPNEIWG